MTEQLKAEAYVRKHRPHLSNVDGFVFAQKKQCNMYLDHRVSWCGDCFACSECGMKFTPTLSPHRQQSIQLNDWLGVLWESNPNLEYTDAQMPLAKFGARAWYGLEKAPSDWLWFDATTGQPATEADYKAFNEITNI